MSDKLLFLKEWLKTPKSIGAVFPSSAQLVNAMLIEVPATAKKIVELGAGTGVFTDALLKRGFAPHQIISIEKNPIFIKSLQVKFPDVTFVEGEAANLLKHNPELLHQADVIISGLPIRLWDKESLLQFENLLSNTLSPNGLFIQFTYQIYSYKPVLSTSFELLRLHRIWLNLPPAAVEVFQTRSRS